MKGSYSCTLAKLKLVASSQGTRFEIEGAEGSILLRMGLSLPWDPLKTSAPRKILGASLRLFTFLGSYRLSLSQPAL